MDYIPKPPEFHVADHELSRSHVAHVQSTDSSGNTSSAHSQPSGGTSSSRRPKRKGPMVDVIENHFNMLNTNLQNCVASMNRGNDVVNEVLVIACVQATSSPMVDVIENHFNMLNTNLQNCVASMNRGNDVVNEVLVIACVQATSSQEIVAEIKRQNNYYGEHVQNNYYCMCSP